MSLRISSRQFLIELGVVSSLAMLLLTGCAHAFDPAPVDRLAGLSGDVRNLTSDFHPAAYRELVFHDEFEGKSIDRREWCTRFPYGGGPALQVPDPECGARGRGTLDFLGKEQQRYVDFNALDEPMHVVRGGVLSLRATLTRPDTSAPYEAGMIRSKRTFRPDASKSYYITARMRLPAMRGSWPAFWLTPGIGPDDQTGWPPEIDILEGPLNEVDTDNILTLTAQAQNWGGEGVKGDTPLLFAHADYDKKTRKLHAAGSLRDIWLEAGLEWTERQACFFIDGQKKACTAYEWKHNDGRLAPAAPLVFNLAIGGWAGRFGIDDSRLPAAFEVDYVRVYQKSVPPEELAFP
jgi:beta-glucanase (GH16 family)